MTSRTLFLTGSLLCTVLFLFSTVAVFADSDDIHHRRQYRKMGHDDDAPRYRRKHGGRYYGAANQVTNAVYLETCGACHFAYPPSLMPEASWMKLLETLDDHFGETLDPDGETRSTLTDYLKANCAEKSRSKCSVRILRSTGSQAPSRITDIPYIINVHHEIPPEVFTRKRVGSFSNCTACHTTAEAGIFNDDYVKIPN